MDNFKAHTLATAPSTMQTIQDALLKARFTGTPRVQLSANLKVDEWILMAGYLFEDGAPRILMNPSWHRTIKRKTDLHIELSTPPLKAPNREPFVFGGS